MPKDPLPYPIYSKHHPKDFLPGLKVHHYAENKNLHISGISKTRQQTNIAGTASRYNGCMFGPNPSPRYMRPAYINII
jgi:hypothetical protein